jgi:hypothetical protein
MGVGDEELEGGPAGISLGRQPGVQV